LKYIHASGSLAETGERVVVSFGPEHAALEQRQVELALTEAETLRPSPKFILFCAFTFDPEAAKDIDEVNWPGVTLLKAQMNTDLLTEDLKKKRASNQSFWLMGQPDVELRKRKDGMWEVEVNGFDYFDPKAGDLVSGGKKQIAMWSLDVDYDNRSLMPHQVFFPMADAKGGWNRLRKTCGRSWTRTCWSSSTAPSRCPSRRARTGGSRSRSWTTAGSSRSRSCRSRAPKPPCP
jgi:adenine-specific DNA-methyltransferase